MEVSINTDDYALQEAWSNLMKPLLETKVERLLSVLSDQISSLYWHHQILDSSFDPISFHRSAIEDHEQDLYRESVDVIINATRDCLEFALKNDPTTANAYIKMWEIRPENLFKRLVLHAYRLRDDLSANDKLRWLIEKNWLWDPYLRHETYYLLSDNVSECDANVVEALLRHARATLPDADEDTSARSLYDLLEWLYRHLPHNQLIYSSWSKERDLHPEWEPKPHPDLLYWMTVGDDTAVPVLSPDTLVHIINENPHEAASKLRLLSSSTGTELSSSRSNIRSAIQTCVARAPEAGLLLSEALSDEDTEVQREIIRGWTDSDLDLETAEKVLQTISEWNIDNIRNVAASMLQGDSSASVWCRIPASQGLAKRLWPESTIRGAIRDNDNDLITEAINHPAGQLSSFWIKVIQHEWKTARDNWQGISSDLSETLLKMLHDTSRNGVLAEVILAANLGFLLSADSDWTKRELIPRFSWTVNPESAAYAWQGFLRMGRPGDKLLDSGFLDHYLDTCAHVNALPNNLEKRLATHLAQITAFGSIAPDNYLTTFITQSPETLILSWIHETTQILSRMESDKVVYQWDRWIRDYWSMRYQTIPRKLSIDENSAMAEWLPYLEPVISDIAPLLVGTPARLNPQNVLLARIGKCNLGQHPGDWIKLLTHLLESTESTSPAIQHQLPRIVSKLREAQNEISLEPLINQALRLEVPLSALHSENDASTNP